MRVLFLTNVPSPYRVEFFNILSLSCDLTVLYEKRSSSERNDKWIAKSNKTYNIHYLKGISSGVDSALSFEVIKFLRGKFDIIVICGISSPTQIIAINYCKAHNISYFIEGDGGIAKEGNGIKERLKRHLISGANGYFSTCDRHDDYYLAYGALKKRIYRYPFTSISEKDIVSNIIDNNKKNMLKRELKIKESRIILSVGQFIYRKGFDILIKCAHHFPDLGFYIVGGTPTDEYNNLVKDLNASNIHFLDFMIKDKLQKYYDVADIFVLPTREDIWGLVVNEAMARALPVITTNNCNAGLEMIKDGVNGYIIPVDDCISLKKAINNVLISNINILREATVETAKRYTLEKMAQRHMEIFEDYLRKGIR